MKKMVLLTGFLIFVTFTPAVLAQTPTRLRATTPSETIAEQAQQLNDRIATNVATLKNKNRHIVGKITTVGSNSITLLPGSGLPVTVTVGATTKIYDYVGGKKIITFNDLKVGNQVAVVGIEPNERSGIAILIFKLTEPVKHQALFGTITKIDIATASAKVSTSSASLATLTVTLKVGTGAQVIITKDTKINIPTISKPTLKDLKLGQKAVATGIIDSQKGFLANKFIVIGQGTLNPTPSIATGSARQETQSGSNRNNSADTLRKIVPSTANIQTNP